MKFERTSFSLSMLWRCLIRMSFCSAKRWISASSVWRSRNMRRSVWLVISNAESLLSTASFWRVNLFVSVEGSFVSWKKWVLILFDLMKKTKTKQKNKTNLQVTLNSLFKNSVLLVSHDTALCSQYSYLEENILIITWIYVWLNPVI